MAGSKSIWNDCFISFSRNLFSGK